MKHRSGDRRPVRGTGATDPRAARHARLRLARGLARALTLAALATVPGPLAWAQTGCDLESVGTFRHAAAGAIPLYREPQTQALAFVAPMQVNADGAPDAYHPDNRGTSHLCDGLSVKVNDECRWTASCLPDYRRARDEGFTGGTQLCIFGFLTDRDGVPRIQGPDDPNPGYYISATALRQPGEPAHSPRAQLDSNTVPFAVLPGSWVRNRDIGLALGDVGVAIRLSTGDRAAFVLGDVGPRQKLGEGSIALHLALGHDPFRMSYGIRRASVGLSGRDVLYVVFPGSADLSERLDVATINALVEPFIARFGGEERLRACATALAP